MQAVIVVNLSELNEDEQQWFSDGFGDSMDFGAGHDITSRMYSDIHDDFKQMKFVGASLGTYKENIRAFIICYELTGSKGSCSGESAVHELHLSSLRNTTIPIKRERHHI